MLKNYFQIFKNSKTKIIIGTICKDIFYLQSYDLYDENSEK